MNHIYYSKAQQSMETYYYNIKSKYIKVKINFLKISKMRNMKCDIFTMNEVALRNLFI